jgi:hypothetical protein
MSDNSPKFGGPEVEQAIGKAEEYAREHPDQARSTIDKVEDVIDQQTGGRFKDLVDKGGDFLEDRLGIPREQAQPPAEPTTPSEPAPPAPTEPTQPAPDPGTPDPTSPDPGEPGPTPGEPAPVPGEPAPADPTGGTPPTDQPATDQPAPGGDADPTTGTGAGGPAQDGGVLGSDREWTPPGQ